MHFWLAHGMTIQQAERETDAKAYSGSDSGCEQATKYLGYPSSCQSCPFKRCTLDKRRQRMKQRNTEIRKLYRRSIAIAEIAVIHRVSPRTVQRVVKGVKVDG